MSEVIKVGMADLKTCRGDDGVTTLGLGSCVGIAIRDPATGIGGLAHIMLPDSTEIKNNTNRPKFADTGIEDLVKEIVRMGGNRSRLVAKIAGGAHMLKSVQIPESSNISSRNLEAVEKKLGEMNIPVLASEVGGHHARTVVFEPGSGAFRIVTRGKEVKVL